MFKLLTNYIREQKTSLIQVFGLGFMIIIMVSAFLSLNFSNTYVSQQYWKEIAQEEFHQEVVFELEPKFRNNMFGDSWLENLNYFNSENNEILKEKMLKATFQITKLSEEEHIYRFYFENPKANVHVGEKFAQTTRHTFIDFKLSVPFNYPSEAKHDEFLKEQAAIIDSYVFDEKDETKKINETNFFIISEKALKFYNDEIKEKYPFAKRNYQIIDIKNQAKLYQLLIMGMLYGSDNLSWTRVYNLNDLIITGKTFSFIQTTPKDKVNVPIIVKNDDFFSLENLQDDEILIYKEFAKENNLQIGQDYIFAGYKFRIVGFATSALAANNAYYFDWKSDNKNQTVAFINQASLEKIINNPFVTKNKNYFFGFNPETGSKNIGQNINNYWIYEYFHQKLINNPKISKKTLYSAKQNAIDVQHLFNPLINYNEMHAIEAIIWTNIDSLENILIKIASIFLGLIFVVVSVIVFIVIFKMIDRNKRIIGILKAHGYPNWKLNIALVLATIFPIVFFAFLGSVVAIIFAHFIISTYSTALILVSYGWPFYYKISLLVIFLPFMILILLSFIMVAFLLKSNTLKLINNNWVINRENFKISVFFSNFLSNVTAKFNYYNKLAITTSFRSFGKIFSMALVSVFASVLLLFSFSSAGLIKNLLGLQFVSINYKYNTSYLYDSSVTKNFINHQNQLLYKKATVKEIKAEPSIYLELKLALEEFLKDPTKEKLIDFRYRYLMGSELYKIRKEVVEPNFDKFPIAFQNFWKQNYYFINYLTNDDGKSDIDLMINFGFLPYNETIENPYTQIDFGSAHDFNINNIDTTKYFYDNDSDTLQGDWNKLKGNSKIAFGVDELASSFLNLGFKNTNFNKFTNLTLENMTSNGGWINNNFLEIRDLIIKKFNIRNPDTAAVKIIPMVSSVIPGAENMAGGDGNNLGKTVLYSYTGLDQQKKYIIGVVYDGAKNLMQNTILMPKLWLNNAIFGIYNEHLAASFANVKFSNFSESELHHYLPIISKKNDYLIDLTKIFISNYFQEKQIVPGINMIYDVFALKDMLLARQYSLQTLIIVFAFFSAFLSFMVIIIISNINIRDNLVLIESLRSLGYSAFEISYIFLLVTIPVLIIFSLAAIFINPFLTGFIASALANFLHLNVSVIFKWWYLALTLLIVFLIYLVSYLITWSSNINNKKIKNLLK